MNKQLYKTYGSDFIDFQMGDRTSYAVQSFHFYYQTKGKSLVHVDDTSKHCLSFDSSNGEWIIHSYGKNLNDLFSGHYFRTFDKAWTKYCQLRGFETE